jgi:hypothetical protein
MTVATRRRFVISPDCADALAAQLLGDLRTTLGGPHVAHARRVAAAVRGRREDRVIAAALLHDVLEKTATTAAELLALTGDPEVVELVEVLSQRDGESYRCYLARCAADPTALLLKRIDLEDKFAVDDATVPPAVVERIQRKARARLALLDRLSLLGDGKVRGPASESHHDPPARG